MITIKSHDLWPEIERLAKNSKNIKAAVAYVSDDSSISFGKGDVLVVDASDSSISGARTSAKVLASAFKKGAKLYSCETLHGKIIVFDQEAYIGSANISKNSKNILDEVGVISDHPSIMAGAIQVIDDLIKQSREIDNSFIQKALKIKVIKDTSSLKKRAKKIKIEKPRSWLISLRNDAEYPGKEERVEEENTQIDIKENEESDWFWLKKGNRVYEEAKAGDSVVIIERERKNAKEPQFVYRHFVIKSITKDPDIAVKAYHYAYTEEHKKKWSNFKKMAEKAGISRLGSGLNTVRQLTERQSNILFELWGD